jgi:lipopolysaccharide transport system ATP-binding protein
MSLPAIEVEKLGKRYLLGEDTSRHRLAHAVFPWLRHERTHDFWALRDVSMIIQPGETVGIIGRNGAGKSTLLKVLSRITAPTEGVARVRGRVGTLLEVGTGFHPELSGRDNIFLSGTILGLTYRQVAKKFDEIVEFSEIGQFIDTPVKRYSSGMYVRLAFAVALYLDPEILIVDEVLAVGDLGFHRKSVGRLSEAAIKHGRTVLFVSHSLEAIRRTCQRVVVLDHGHITFDGSVEEGIGHYLKSIPKVTEVRDVALADRLKRTSGLVRFTKVEARDQQGAARWVFEAGESVTFRFEYEALAEVPELGLLFNLNTKKDEVSGVPEIDITRMRGAISRHPVPAGHKGTVEVVLHDLKLRPGQFGLYVCLGNLEGEIFHDVIDNNVYLPDLVVKSDATNKHDRFALVSMDYDFRVVDRESEFDAPMEALNI